MRAIWRTKTYTSCGHVFYVESTDIAKQIVVNLQSTINAILSGGNKLNIFSSLAISYLCRKQCNCKIHINTLNGPNKRIIWNRASPLLIEPESHRRRILTTTESSLICQRTFEFGRHECNNELSYTQLGWLVRWAVGCIVVRNNLGRNIDTGHGDARRSRGRVARFGRTNSNNTTRVTW